MRADLLQLGTGEVEIEMLRAECGSSIRIVGRDCGVQLFVRIGVIGFERRRGYDVDELRRVIDRHENNSPFVSGRTFGLAALAVFPPPEIAGYAGVRSLSRVAIPDAG